MLSVITSEFPINASKSFNELGTTCFLSRFMSSHSLWQEPPRIIAALKKRYMYFCMIFLLSKSNIDSHRKTPRQRELRALTFRIEAAFRGTPKDDRAAPIAINAQTPEWHPRA